jgi:hypothetical protein
MGHPQPPEPAADPDDARRHLDVLVRALDDCLETHPVLEDAAEERIAYGRPGADWPAWTHSV